VEHVPESRFGVWFLSTKVWDVHVLDIAVADLVRLIPNRRASYPVVLDLGCGNGRSFQYLWKQFDPELIIGADIDRTMLEKAAEEADRLPVEIGLVQGNSSRLGLADGSVDLLFCHQTFHHLVAQEEAIAEFRRVLRPGGLLLFAESTRCFIHSWTIRYLFRHPMDKQKSAEQYVLLIRKAGFRIESDAISYPYLWWSRPDLGIRERLFGRLPADRAETLVNLVAIKCTNNS
jgi:ubiquinone/menaquinone biosynthesis C-methylase UbiE